MTICVEMGVGRWRTYTGISLASYIRVKTWAAAHGHRTMNASHRYAYIAHRGTFLLRSQS